MRAGPERQSLPRADYIEFLDVREEHDADVLTDSPFMRPFNLVILDVIAVQAARQA